jgi:hypothetical protein
MRKWNLPLTYEPKIQPVIDGTCRQTIRPVKKPHLEKKIGDLIRFYIWTGKPYRSKRKTITEYMPLVNVKSCRISYNGIDDLYFVGEVGLWGWKDLDRLAELDGIVPPTGEALRDILMEKNNVTTDWIDAQVLRW